MWLPDTCLRSAIEFNLRENDLRIYHDGTVYWSRIGTIKVAHNFDLTKYPSDTQNVTIQVESWINPNMKINYTLSDDPLPI
jgi:hypothetical protein